MTKRMPRPIGTTHLSYLYNQAPDKATKKLLRKKLNNHLIKAFINEALLIPESQEYGEWNKLSEKTGKVIKAKVTTRTLPTANKKTIKKGTKNIVLHKTKTVLRTIRFHELAHALGWSIPRLEERVQSVIAGQGQKLLKTNSNHNTEWMARVASSRLFFKSLEGLEKATDWAEEIRHQTRTGGYRASTIMAANSAMGTELQFLKVASDQASKFLPRPGINYTKNQTLNVNNHGTQQDEQGSENGPDILNGSQYLSPTMAMRMLEDAGQNPIPSRENGMLETIALDNGLYGKDLVSVSATLNDAQGKTSGFNPQEVIEKINHNTRRVHDYNIVDDAVDVMDEDVEVM